MNKHKPTEHQQEEPKSDAFLGMPSKEEAVREKDYRFVNPIRRFKENKARRKAKWKATGRLAAAFLAPLIAIGLIGYAAFYTIESAQIAARNLRNQRATSTPPMNIDAEINSIMTFDTSSAISTIQRNFK